MSCISVLQISGCDFQKNLMRLIGLTVRSQISKILIDFLGKSQLIIRLALETNGVGKCVLKHLFMKSINGLV